MTKIRLFLLFALSSILPATPWAVPIAIADPVIQKMDVNWRPADAVDFVPNEGWDIRFVDGAEGTSRLTTGEDGRSVLEVTKSNGLGFVMIRPDQDLPLEVGKKYVVRCVYRSDDSPFSTMLGLHVDDDPRASIQDIEFKVVGHWTMGHMFTKNTPPGEWSSRVFELQGGNQFKPGRYAQGFGRIWPDGSFPYILVYGNPHTVTIRQVQLYPQREGQSKPKPQPIKPFAKAQVLDILAQRQPASLEIVPVNGTPTFMKDGSPIAPAYSYKLQAHNYQFGRMGQKVDLPTTVSVMLGPTFKGQIPGRFQGEDPFIWTGKGQIDFDKLDAILMDVYRQNPHADVILGLVINPYEQWIEENPAETAYNQAGVRAYKRVPKGPELNYWKRALLYGEALPADNPAADEIYYRQPSVYSEKYWSDVADVSKQILEWVKDSPYGNSIVGFGLMGMQDSRFEPGPIDWHPNAQAAFRDFLREKYGTTQALSRAWKQRVESFDTVVIPPPSQLDNSTAYHVDGPWKDAMIMHKAQTWRAVDRLAGLLKAAWPRPSIIATYNVPNEQAFLDAQHIDLSPNYYVYGIKDAGYVSAWTGLEMLDASKMWANDHDLRTHFTRPPGRKEEFDMQMSRSLDMQHFAAIHDKNTGVNLARGGGYFYFEHGGNNFMEFAPILDHAKSRQQIAARVARLTKADTFRPDVVVVRGNQQPHFDDRRIWAGYSQEIVEGGQLAISGVPFDQMTIQTLMQHPRRDAYKVYLFSQNVRLNDAERAFIDSLKRDGRTLVFMGDVGYMSEDGLSIDKMAELIGIRARTSSAEQRRTPMIIQGAPYTEDALPFAGGDELYFAAMKPRGFSKAPVNSRPSQAFWIEDDAATPLMKYAEDGKTAAAMRKYDDWTSIYIAARFAIEPGVLNAIAEEAGAYVASTPGGKSLDMSGVFASIHCIKSGTYSLKLPKGKTKLRDAFTNEFLPVENGVAQLTLTAQKTYWYFFE
ncbi:MAG: hypothetical protein AAGG02_06825 [Cyanobacteria bacterium P01_H01_bin.15]